MLIYQRVILLTNSLNFSSLDGFHRVDPKSTAQVSESLTKMEEHHKAPAIRRRWLVYLHELRPDVLAF
jgi:hypothetical protein